MTKDTYIILTLIAFGSLILSVIIVKIRNFFKKK